MPRGTQSRARAVRTLQDVESSSQRPITRSVFPGQELVDAGLSDLSVGKPSVEAHLVALAAPRLRSVGVRVPANKLDDTGEGLYLLLRASDPPVPDSYYSALLRRVASYCAAREQDARRRP